MPLEAHLGAEYLGEEQCRFSVWAPNAEGVEVLVADNPRSLQPTGDGYYTGIVEGVKPGDRYFYKLQYPDREPAVRPDPASRYQPEGVHGPSAVTDRSTAWDVPGWAGISLTRYVLYELHVGTYTSKGTFEALIAHLDRLKELGVTAIEIMPVSQFPGGRNWGYDGVFPYAPQNTYGGPDGLRQLVSACHERGLAVVLDVVYNHLGPEGNYLRDFGPYFTNSYNTPWGEAVNLDGEQSDHVRRFFIENALYWVSEFRIDALRLDAVHALKDFSARTFLTELAAAVQAQAEIEDRRIYCIAESDLNDTRIIRPRALGGFELHAQWNDDFHHALHALTTGEDDGYYADFGRLSHLAKAFSDGYVYSGDYSKFRERRHGNSSRSIPAASFVVYSQNHDQVGNRMLGDRLNRLITFEQQKLTAAAVLLSPFIPLLFMGEEYGETAPFQYFISHEDAHLVELVREGRKSEFAAFNWQQPPPDPQSEETFARSMPDHERIHRSPHRELYMYYSHLLRLRREIPALARLSKKCMDVICEEAESLLVVHRWWKKSEVLIAMNFSDHPVTRNPGVNGTHWHCRLDSADGKWAGPGGSARETVGPENPMVNIAAQAVVVYEQAIQRAPKGFG